MRCAGLLFSVLLTYGMADSCMAIEPSFEAKDDATLSDAPFTLRRMSLLERDPVKPTAERATTPDDIARERLRQMEQIEEEEFTAPPLVVARISALPVPSDDTATQGLYRAERNIIRERARAADRMFRSGNMDGAIAVMKETERLLTSTDLRIAALNRIAAYYFRADQLERGAEYARLAWEMDPSDVISACNLSAILLTMERIDEAIDILLRIYGRAFDHPKIGFGLHFNLACAHSLKGNEIAALQNLILAAQTDPIATYAALGDTHLDRIRQTELFIRFRVALEDLLGLAAPRDER